MEISEALRTFLLSDSNIAAAVAARVYPVQLPQNTTLDSIRYAIISGNRSHASPQGAIGLSGPRVQIDAVSQGFDTAYSLAELIRKRIDGYRGLMGTVKVQGVFFDSERTDFEPEPKLHVFSRDFFIWFEEEIA